MAAHDTLTLFGDTPTRPTPALTVKQRWAHLIIHGGKDVENRSWSTNHRGRLWIHAGRAVDDDSPDVQGEVVFGAIIGHVTLVDVIRDSRSTWAIPGEWHWVLTDPTPVERLVRRGQMGLWVP